MQRQEAYFHIVRQFSSLENIARRLYSDTHSASARDFLRINAAAANGEGYVMAGQILYIPDAVCYAPALDADVIEVVKRSNEGVRYRLTGPQARLLAQHPILISNAASHSLLIKGVAGIGGNVAGGLISIAQMQTRLIGNRLKKLEALYKHSYRANGGKLGPQFYVQRRRIYESLDSAVGRLSRTIALGTPLDEEAKRALKINTKSQILHWKRHGTGGSLYDFDLHFERMGRITRYLNAGNYLAIGIDGYLTYDTITKACEVGDDRHCHKAMLAEGGGFVGRSGGGAVAGTLAYIACNALFGLETGGTSLLWCGIVVGGAGGTIGGEAVGRLGKGLGNLVFEKIYPTTQP